jgi:hypothetical protein
MIGPLAVAIVMSVPVSTTPGSTIPLPEGYVPVVDDTNTLVVAAPETWTDIVSAPWTTEDGSQQPLIVVSPDTESFRATFDTPGVLYSAVPYTDDLLSVFTEYGLQSGCETMEAKTYDDPVFVGIIQIGTDCGDQHLTWNMIVANPIVPTATPFTALLQVQSADPAEIRNILLTFNIVEPAA